MEYDDVLTRNDDGELSVRTVSATEQSTVVNPNDVYTRDTDGNLAVRVVGNGGDSHNKGYYATPEALSTAYPTAEAGDFAIVESTDTVWIWDSDTNAWKDSDQKGQVTSVNNQTGEVVITLSDLGGQEELVSGTNIKTIDGNSILGSGNLELSTYLTYPNTWTTNSTTKAFCDDIAADTDAIAGKAYLGEVTFSDLPASMANGEVVVEIMSGTTAQNKIIVLILTSGNTAPYMWKYTYWNGGTNVSGWIGFQQQLTAGNNITISGSTISATDTTYSAMTGATDSSAGTSGLVPAPAAGDNDKYLKGDGSWGEVDALPSQTGNSGKFLTTDGTDASWSNSKVLINSVDTSNTTSINIDGVNMGTQRCVSVGKQASSSEKATAVGYNSYSGQGSCALGYEARTFRNSQGFSTSIAIGFKTTVGAYNAIQLGTMSVGNNSGIATEIETVNTDANTFKVANVNGNFEMMSADGTVPSDRLVNSINKYATMPTAASTNEGWIVQYTGTTDANYTHGYIYECKAQGTTPDETYAWEEVTIQASGLPSQTGNAGKVLFTNGSVARWDTPTTITMRTWGANE